MLARLEEGKMYSMDEKNQNELAKFLTGGLSDQEREATVSQLLADPEASQLLSLLALQDFRTENNLALPFSTPSGLVLGCCQNLVLPLEMQEVRYTGGTAGLATRAAALLKASEGSALSTSTIEFESVSLPGSPSIRFTVRAAAEDSSWLLYVSSNNGGHRVLEFWEGGAVVLRAPLRTLAAGLPYRIKPGMSLAIREAGAYQGCRLLMVETEFSHQDWTSALVSACLSGDLGLATQLLKSKLATSGLGVSIRSKVGAQISALASLTKTHQNILQPAPVTRAGEVDPEQFLSVYGLVWSGVVQCWPEAGAIPNPWTDAAESPAGQATTAGALDPAAGLLAMACIRTALGSSVQDSPPDAADLRLRNGWTALAGWGALLKRDSETAHKIFSSGESTQGDPFGLELGRMLSQHLQSFEGTNQQDRAASGDQVWDLVLSPLN